MTALRLDFVHVTRAKGKTYHYFRRDGWPNVRLPGLPGSREFMAAYQSALARQAPEPDAVAEVAPGSFNALCVAFYKSAGFTTLAVTTQATYRRIIERFRAQHGGRLVADLERKHIEAILDRISATPEAANNLLKILKVMFKLALRRGMVKADPTSGVARVANRSDGHKDWTAADLATFLAHWHEGSRERLALRLLLDTGQRRGDVVRLGWRNVRGDVIALVQEKTGQEVTVPILPDLAAALVACPKDAAAFLMTAHGRPFTSNGFGNWFGDAARAAGLARLTAHGLRKTAAVQLADAGCTTHEIAAITGHKSLKEVERYTLGANRAANARAATRKLILGRATPPGP